MFKRQTDRQTETERDRETEIETETDTERDRDSEISIYYYYYCLTTQPTVAGAVLASPLFVLAQTHLVSVVSTVRDGVPAATSHRTTAGNGSAPCTGYGSAPSAGYGSGSRSGHGAATTLEKKTKF